MASTKESGDIIIGRRGPPWWVAIFATLLGTAGLSIAGYSAQALVSLRVDLERVSGRVESISQNAATTKDDLRREMGDMRAELRSIAADVREVRDRLPPRRTER